MGTRRLVSLLTIIVVLSVNLALAASPGWAAAEKGPLNLTLNQAVSAALGNSESLKKAEKETERTEELRDYRAQQIDFTPTEPAGSALVEVPWSNLLMADLTWRMSKKSLTSEQDSLALDTCKKYWDVLTAYEKIKAAEASLSSAQRQLRRSRAGYQVGLVTRTALIAAEVQYSNAQSNLNSAKNDLDKAYAALNTLVGLKPEDRPVLTDEITFTPLKVDNLDTEVAKVLENAPTVWLANENVTLQKYLEDMSFYTGEYRPYLARKIEVEQKELDAASTKKAYKQLTRSLYYGIKSLEEAYAGAQEGTRVAEENLRVAKVKLTVGMATPADVTAAEKALAEAKAASYDLACQHAYMKLAFAKPWAYLSALSSSATDG
ncbi:MAG: TolC family protein [Bacillota bacterium]